MIKKEVTGGKLTGLMLNVRQWLITEIVLVKSMSFELLLITKTFTKHDHEDFKD